MNTVLESLTGGFLMNLEIFALTLVMALPLGLVITFGSMARFKPLRYVTRVFVWIIRGTPLMLQLFVVMYAPGLLLGTPMKSRMTAVLIAFVINYAAYFSEIYRGGIESIPKGQYEAGQVLGMTKSQVFFRVVLLQVVKRVTPPMSNEVITLVKDTALAQTIGVMELFRLAQNAQSRAFSTVPIVIAGIFYLVLNYIVEQCFHLMEKRLSYYR